MKLVVITAAALLAWAPGASAATRYDADRTIACLVKVGGFGLRENSWDWYSDLRGQIELTGEITLWFSPKLDEGEQVLFTSREAGAVRIFRLFRQRARANGLTAAQARRVIGHKGNAVWGPNDWGPPMNDYNSPVEVKEAIALHVGTKIRRCLR